MKPLLPGLLTLLAAAQPLSAQLFADFSTSLGDFTVEFDHATAPRTVARFVLHAEGAIPWIDETTGALRKEPYYDGLLFHRAVNISGFKVIQSGSRTSTARRGIGFVLPDDELARTHDPYVISMANRGPNTNGPEFFVVGNEAASGLDVPARHIVFGQIPASDTAGRATVDAIVASVPTDADAAPDPPVTLHSVTIRRENGVSFDPTAQGVPILSAPPFEVLLAGDAVDLVFPQPPRSMLTVDHGDNLQSWSGLERFLDATSETASSFQVPGAGQGTSHFFRPVLASYAADGIFPGDLVNRTLTLKAPLSAPNVDQTFVFSFGADGTSGTWTLDDPPIGGDIVDASNSPDPYGTDSSLQMSGINFPYVRFRLGFDTATAGEFSGRASGRLTQIPSDLFSPQPIFQVINFSGTFTLTR